MKKLILLSVIIFGAIHIYAQQKWNYPPAPKIPVYDTIFGKVIKDDYRWMEKADDPKFVAWLQAQKKFTDSVMAQVPGTDQLLNEFKSSFNKIGSWYSAVHKTGDLWTYRIIQPDFSETVYLRNGTDGEEKVWFEPNKILAPKGHRIQNFRFFPSGKLALVNTQEGGSEVSIGRFVEIPSGKFLKDTIAGWANNSVFEINNRPYVLYSKFSTTNVRDIDFLNGMQWSLYEVGSGKEAVPVFNPKNYPELSVNEQSHLLVSQSVNSPYVLLLYYPGNYAGITSWFIKKTDLIQNNFRWQKMKTPYIEPRDGREMMLNGDKVFYLTHLNHSGEEIRMSKFSNGSENQSEVIFKPEKGWAIHEATMTRDYIAIVTTKNALVSKVYKYNLKNGSITEMKFDLDGIIEIIPTGTQNNEVTLYSNSWTGGLMERYHLNLDTGKVTSAFFTRKFERINPNLVVEEVEVKSHDGAMVPLSLIYDKTQLKKDGGNIVQLYSYGSFGFSQMPRDMQLNNPLYTRGVIYAVAHVRGGAEKGADWHKAALKDKKPNSWKDFHACAEWLIANKYSSKGRIHAEGASAGGLLAGRAVTDRPDLYGSAMIGVGLLNPMRMEFSPNGSGLVDEYGSVHKAEDIDGLLEMDSYHQIKHGVKYPGQFITGGYNDPRVIIWQPAKYVAAMQAANASDYPILFDVNMEGGHGSNPGEQLFRDYAQKWAFLLWQTGHPDFQPK